MNVGQERADFESFLSTLGLHLGKHERQLMFIAYQAGRAAPQPQEAKSVAALRKALQALEAISDEMTVGDRFTNAGQYLIDALGPVREAIDHARRFEGEWE